MATAETFLSKFRTIKTLPHVALRLSKMISDDKCSMEEFEEIIKMDPTLVIRILRLVNSPYYALREKVKSISQALLFIGMNNLRNMVALEAVKAIFRNTHETEGFSRSNLWLHCAAVSICGQMVSERIFGKNGEDAFLCGILHDVGMIVEDQVAPEIFSRIVRDYQSSYGSFVQYENDVIGTDHCKIGYLLAQDWKLSLEIQDGIKRHHTYTEAITPSSMAGIIQIAEYLVARLNMTAFPSMKYSLSDSIKEHIRETIEEYRVLSNDLPQEIARAKELYEIDSDLKEAAHE